MKQKILPIMASSFALACLLQLGNLAGAKAPDIEAATIQSFTQIDTQPDSSSLDTESSAQAEKQCLTPVVATALREQKARLETQLIDLEKREKALEALDSRLKTELATLSELKSTVEEQVSGLREIADEDLTHLVEMYSTMKPQNAAEIFDNMPAAFAAGFLREMNGTRAGMVMSEMNAKKSFEISLIIANSNAHWRCWESRCRTRTKESDR